MKPKRPTIEELYGPWICLYCGAIWEGKKHKHTLTPRPR
jgi:hypothetical protein